MSIVTEGDALAATQIEVSKRIQADEIEEELLPMMFARGRPESEQFGGGSYTTKDQKALLEAHNNHRKKPSASDMNELLWSPALAEQAQAWSDGCYYEHPDKTQHPDYRGIGQNLYIKWLDKGGRNPPPVTDPVDKWYDEVKDFHYDINSCNRGAVCGHYTQVVWAKTTKVGCGIKFCPTATSRTRSFENAWLVTCNYSPAGNMQSQSPYKSGTRCSQCAKGFCMKNLCSRCKPNEKGCVCNMVCNNGGKLNSKKCTCKCANGFFGPACQERCEDKNDKCGANPGWPKFWCGDARFPFVQEFCPALCGQCKQ